MDNFWARLSASVICAVIFCCMTYKTVGAMQQGGYKNRTFYRWLRRGDNMFFNRLAVLSLCLGLTTAVSSVAFSFLGRTWALLISALPFFTLLGVFFEYLIIFLRACRSTAYRIFLVGKCLIEFVTLNV